MEDLFLLSIMDFLQRYNQMERKIIFSYQTNPSIFFDTSYSFIFLKEYGFLLQKKSKFLVEEMSKTEFLIINESLIYFNVDAYDCDRPLRRINPKIYLKEEINKEKTLKKGMKFFGYDCFRISFLECCGRKMNDGVIKKNKIFIDNVFLFIKEMCCGLKRENKIDKVNVFEYYVLVLMNQTIDQVKEVIEKFNFWEYVLIIKKIVKKIFNPVFIQNTKEVLGVTVKRFLIESIVKLIHPMAPKLSSFLWENCLGMKNGILKEKFSEKFLLMEVGKDFEEYLSVIEELVKFVHKIKGIYQLKDKIPVFIVLKKDLHFRRCLLTVMKMFFNLKFEVIFIKNENEIKNQEKLIENSIGKYNFFIPVVDEMNFDQYLRSIHKRIFRIKVWLKSEKIRSENILEVENHLNFIEENEKNFRQKGKDHFDLIREEKIRNFPLKKFLIKKENLKRRKKLIIEINLLQFYKKTLSWIQKDCDFDVINNNSDIKICSYNVLCDSLRDNFEFLLQSDTRYSLQLRMFERNQFDILLLNEVTDNYIKIMKKDLYIQENYYLIDFKQNKPFKNFILISKKKIKVVELFHLKPSQISCLFLICEHNSSTICFTVTHLKARARKAFMRKKQIDILFSKIFELCEEKKVQMLFACGDYNMHSKIELDYLKSFNLIDLREEFDKKMRNPKKFTFDSSTNEILKEMYGEDYIQKKDFDRIFYHNFDSKKDMKIKEIKIFGEKKELDYKEKKIHLSDHYGLSMIFKL